MRIDALIDVMESVEELKKHASRLTGRKDSSSLSVYLSVCVCVCVCHYFFLVWCESDSNGSRRKLLSSHDCVVSTSDEFYIKLLIAMH